MNSDMKNITGKMMQLRVIPMVYYLKVEDFDFIEQHEKKIGSGKRPDQVFTEIVADAIRQYKLNAMNGGDK